ncbi:hypothetical protein QAD02_024462 [Eretmocerus hayati]|uniref:Uncharacterized protein n=2 Tax=Eretmocerus hayati TaxID=131215 RepID=A0ACC2N1P4_9HYME|nr:hypothetical protein QAD02_005881 [Eretmocerus hayati]KAJ8688667.1 hypothetical protein QAD02_024462 [Eretmocerus hayati]
MDRPKSGLWIQEPNVEAQIRVMGYGNLAPENWVTGWKSGLWVEESNLEARIRGYGLGTRVLRSKPLPRNPGYGLDNRILGPKSGFSRAKPDCGLETWFMGLEPGPKYGLENEF